MITLKLDECIFKKYDNKLKLTCICGADMVRNKIGKKSDMLMCSWCCRSWKKSEKSFMSCSGGDTILYLFVIFIDAYIYIYR